MKFFSSFSSPSSSSLSFLRNTKEGEGVLPPLLLPGLTAIGSDSASLLRSSEEEEEKARKEEERDDDVEQGGRDPFSSSSSSPPWSSSSLQWSEECPFFTIHLVLASSPSSFLQAYHDEDEKQKRKKTSRMFSSSSSRHQEEIPGTSVNSTRFHRVEEDDNCVYLSQTGSSRGEIEEKKTQMVFVSSYHLPLWSSMFERSYRRSLPFHHGDERASLGYDKTSHDLHKKTNTDPSMSLSIVAHEENEEKKGKLLVEGVSTPPSNTHTCSNSLEDLTIAGTGGAGQGSPASSISSLPPAIILLDDDSSSSSPSYQRHIPSYSLSIAAATTSPSLPSIPSSSASASSLGSSLMMIGFHQKNNKGGGLAQSSEYGGTGKCCFLSNTSSACKWRRSSLSSTTLDDDRGVSLDTTCSSSEQPTLSSTPGAAHFMNTHSQHLQSQSIGCCSSSSSSSSSNSPSLYGEDVEASSSPLKMLGRIALGIEVAGQHGEGREEVGGRQQEEEEDRSPSTVDFTTPRSSPPSSPLFNYTTTSSSSAKHLGDDASTINQVCRECSSSSSSSDSVVLERRNVSTPSSVPQPRMISHGDHDDENNPLFSLHLSDEEREGKEEQGKGKKPRVEEEVLSRDQAKRCDGKVEEEHAEALSREDSCLFHKDLLLTSLLQDELKRFLDISFNHSVKDSLVQRRREEEQKKKIYQSVSGKEEVLSHVSPAAMTPTPLYFVCWVPPASFYHPSTSSYQHLEKEKDKRQGGEKERSVYGEHRSPCSLFTSGM